jgi:protein tyrosine phosphatase
MSHSFQNFGVLEKIVELMNHEQFIIQSDAQRTFDTIMKGPRIMSQGKKQEKNDSFIDWVEKNNQTDRTLVNLNKLFMEMRKSDSYSFKRLSIKLQYEILTLGLESSIINLMHLQKSAQVPIDNAQLKDLVLQNVNTERTPYFHFANYFVDDKQNLKDIM